MMSSLFFALFIVSSIYIPTANGWGATGHSLVARIAQTTLTSDSKQFVRDHLPWFTAGDLSMVGSWADTILYPDTNPVDYLNWQWSKELHYVNTPDWACNYDRNRDCDWAGGQRCIDGAIQNYTKRLADTQQDDIQRQEALKFLVHFIGDIHQPLHGGFAGDRGGNSIRGRFFDRTTNLHSLWDTLMIERRISIDFQGNQTRYYTYLLDILHTTYIRNISQWSKCPSADQSKYLACSTAWIDEDVELNCEHVYRDEQNRPFSISQQFSLGQTYYNTRMVYVEQRLLQSGIRLGDVINKIVELQKHDQHKKKSGDFCSGTMRLVMILFFEGLLLFICLMNFRGRRALPKQPLAETPPKYEVLNDFKA